MEVKSLEHNQRATECYKIIAEDCYEELRFRSFIASDSEWLTEAANDPEVAKYAFSIYPRTEHEVAGFLKEALKEENGKHIVAELNGEPAGFVSIYTLSGRSRHIASPAIEVRRRFWGRGVGTALMEKAIELAGTLGCRKLTLGVSKGNG